MLDEMTIDDTNIDFSYLAEFENVDFVICMNPRLSNTEQLNSKKCTLKGKKFFPKSMVLINTPTLTEIIWDKNVRAIVVCGFLMK